MYKWRILVITAAILLFLLPAYAYAGGLGGLFKMSKKQEKSIAAEMLEEFKKEPGLIEEGEYYDQVQKIGKALVELNRLEEYDYKFFLIDQDEVNAFATPAGYIYVTKGLMDYFAYDKAMLAGVMAHELGHAKDRHVAKGYEKMLSGAAGLTVLGLFLGNDSEDLMNVLFTGGSLVLLKYNRDQEEWADRYGVELTFNAGYDPYGMVRALECLEVLYGSADAVSEYMMQHPATDKRVERTLKIAKEITGMEHGYRKIPSPTTREHPLFEKYGDESALEDEEKPVEVTKSTPQVRTTGKTTSPVRKKEQDPVEIR